MTATDSAIVSRPKVTLVALLVVAFLCGAAAGAIGMKNYAFRMAHKGFVAVERKKMTLERWRDALNLTPEQTEKIGGILDDFDKYYDNVVGEGHERILQVLTPEQQRKFEKMVREQN